MSGNNEAGKQHEEQTHIKALQLMNCHSIKEDRKTRAIKIDSKRFIGYLLIVMEVGGTNKYYN